MLVVFSQRPAHELETSKLVINQKSGLQTSQITLPRQINITQECPVLLVASEPRSALHHLVTGDAAMQNAPTAHTIPENCLQT